MFNSNMGVFINLKIHQDFFHMHLVLTNATRAQKFKIFLKVWWISGSNAYGDQSVITMVISMVKMMNLTFSIIKMEFIAYQMK